MDQLSIYYNDNDNTFEDDFGIVEHSVIGIMTVEDMIYYKQVGGTYYRVFNGIRYELVFPFREDTRALQYDSESNMMYDEDGEIVFNIFSIIDPNTLYLFKKNKKDMEAMSISGGYVSLMWID